MNILPCSNYDNLWIKFPSRLLSSVVPSTKLLTTALNVMVKDSFFIASNQPLQKNSVEDFV